MKHRVLIAEDDTAILTGLVDLLEGEGFAVVTARDGAEAIARHAEAPADLILLDIMMPEKSGYDVCREIRRTDPVTPIIMLTAKGEEVDRVVGLELGADDYVVKPFGANELVARVRAVLRRGRPREERGAGRTGRDAETLRFADVTVDPRTLRGTRGRVEFDVTQRELALLRLLTSRPGEALDRDTIMDAVWGVRYEGTTRTLDQHIVGLRKKVESDPAHHDRARHGVQIHAMKKGAARPPTLSAH